MKNLLILEDKYICIGQVRYNSQPYEHTKSKNILGEDNKSTYATTKIFVVAIKAPFKQYFLYILFETFVIQNF